MFAVKKKIQKKPCTNQQYTAEVRICSIMHAFIYCQFTASYYPYTALGSALTGAVTLHRNTSYNA